MNGDMHDDEIDLRAFAAALHRVLTGGNPSSQPLVNQVWPRLGEAARTKCSWTEDEVGSAVEAGRPEVELDLYRQTILPNKIPVASLSIEAIVARLNELAQ